MALTAPTQSAFTALPLTGGILANISRQLDGRSSFCTYEDTASGGWGFASQLARTITDMACDLAARESWASTYSAGPNQSSTRNSTLDTTSNQTITVTTSLSLWQQRTYSLGTTNFSLYPVIQGGTTTSRVEAMDTVATTRLLRVATTTQVNFDAHRAAVHTLQECVESTTAATYHAIDGARGYSTVLGQRRFTQSVVTIHSLATVLPGPDSLYSVTREYTYTRSRPRVSYLSESVRIGQFHAAADFRHPGQLERFDPVYSELSFGGSQISHTLWAWPRARRQGGYVPPIGGSIAEYSGSTYRYAASNSSVVSLVAAASTVTLAISGASAESAIFGISTVAVQRTDYIPPRSWVVFGGGLPNSISHHAEGSPAAATIYDSNGSSSAKTYAPGQTQEMIPGDEKWLFETRGSYRASSQSQTVLQDGPREF